MKIYELNTDGEVKEISELPRGVMLSCAFGCFDGVHLGHRALLEAAVADAKLLSARTRGGGRISAKDGDRSVSVGDDIRVLSAVWTFSEPLSRPWMISVGERLSLCGKCGIAYALCERFEDVRDLLPEEFIGRLVREARLCHAVCGYDFRFGRQRVGDSRVLGERLLDALSAHGVLGAADGIGKALLEHPVTVVDKVSVGGEAVSSTRIRKALSAGDVETARELLGRPYTLTGRILAGKQIGRTISRPTANLRYSEDQLIPRYGVYYTLCRIDGETCRSITNIGCRPTVNSDRTDVTCEAHLLDFDRSVYGKTAELAFLRFVRPEIAFSDTAALSEQIGADAAGAERFFGEAEAAELKAFEL